MDDIKAILLKNDIAGIVVLHTPGYSEYLFHISPTYSCATFDSTTAQLRVRARLQDYKGDKQIRDQFIKDTTNMFHHLSTVGGRLIMQTIEVSEILDKQVNAEHFGDGHSSHQEQNT